MADLRGRLAKITALITELGITRSVESVYCSAYSSVVKLDRDGFGKLLKTQRVKNPKSERHDDFLNIECELRGVKFECWLWSKSDRDVAVWASLNQMAGAVLESKASKPLAIANKSRPLGLPAPEVIDA